MRGSAAGRKGIQDNLQRRYLSYVEWRYGRLPIAHFRWERREPFFLPLKEAFVPLRLAKGMPKYDRWQADEVAEEVALGDWISGLSRVALLGFPGSGKTTILRWLALSAIEGSQKRLKGKIPLLISLAKWASQRQRWGEGYSITRFMGEQLVGAGWAIPESYFAQIMEEGSALLLLDGLDEVLDPGLRGEMAELVEALAQANPDNLCVVSSRVSGYEEASLDASLFPPFTILELSGEEIASFWARWPHQELERDLVPESWICDPGLEALARSPLGLGVVMANFQPQYLPNQKAKLWDKYASLLLAQWDESKGLPKSAWGEETKRRRLGELAYWLHSLGRGKEDATAISYPALHTKLSQHMRSEPSPESEDEAGEFLHHVRVRSGFLIFRGSDICGFESYQAQEQLAACEVLHQYRTQGGIAFLQRILRESAQFSVWKEALLLALARLPWRTASRQLLNLIKVDSGPEGDPLRRAALFAGYCVGSGLHLEDEVVDQVLDKLVVLGSASRLAAQREQFADALASLVMIDSLEERVLQRLEQAFWKASKGQEREVTLMALKSMGLKGREKALETLRRLAETKDPEVLGAIAEVLLALGQTDEGSSLLIDLLDMDGKVPRELRQKAIITLGQLERPNQAVLDALHNMAEARQDDALRVAAACAIGNLGKKREAASLLLDVARTSSNAVLRRSALDAMVELGVADENLVEELFQLSLNGVTEAVRSAAATALGKLGQRQPSVGDKLRDIFRGEGPPGVKLAAAEALGRIGQKEEGAAALLEVVLSSDNPRIKRDAITSIAGLGVRTDAIVTELVALAETAPSDDLRRAAAEALGLLGEKEASLGALLEIARSPSGGWVRRDAVAALGRLGEPNKELLDELQALARTADDERIRLVAAEAMAKLGDPKGAALWLLGLARGAKGEWVRRDSLKALGDMEIEDEAIAEGVATLLGEGTPDALRHQAAEVLIRWGQEERAIKTLLEIADGSSDDRLRREAIYSLEAVGKDKPEVLDSLLRIASDERHRWVAEAALEVSHRLVFGGQKKV